MTHTARSAAALAAVALLFSACMMEGDTITLDDDGTTTTSSSAPPDTDQGDTSGDDTPAQDADPEPIAGSLCLWTMHTQIEVDGTTYPSFLGFRLSLSDSAFGADFSAFGEDFNSGNPVTGEIVDGEAEAQLGIMAYGDYFFPEVTIGGDMVDLPLDEPYTVDASEGPDTESCLEFALAVIP